MILLMKCFKKLTKKYYFAEINHTLSTICPCMKFLYKILFKTIYLQQIVDEKDKT